MAASFTEQAANFSAQKKGPVYVGLYEANPSPTTYEVNENGPVDPLLKWRRDPSSKVPGPGRYFPLRLAQSLVGKCPVYVNAKMQATSDGMFADPKSRLAFDGVRFKYYLLIFTGGKAEENYVIVPLNEWESIVGVVQIDDALRASNLKIKRVLDVELISSFRDALLSLQDSSSE